MVKRLRPKPTEPAGETHSPYTAGGIKRAVGHSPAVLGLDFFPWKYDNESLGIPIPPNGPKQKGNRQNLPYRKAR